MKNQPTAQRASNTSNESIITVESLLKQQIKSLKDKKTSPKSPKSLKSLKTPIKLDEKENQKFLDKNYSAPISNLNIKAQCMFEIGKSTLSQYKLNWLTYAIDNLFVNKCSDNDTAKYSTLLNLLQDDDIETKVTYLSDFMNYNFNSHLTEISNYFGVFDLLDSKSVYYVDINMIKCKALQMYTYVNNTTLEQLYTNLLIGLFGEIVTAKYFVNRGYKLLEYNDYLMPKADYDLKFLTSMNEEITIECKYHSADNLRLDRTLKGTTYYRLHSSKNKSVTWDYLFVVSFIKPDVMQSKIEIGQKISPIYFAAKSPKSEVKGRIMYSTQEYDRDWVVAHESYITPFHNALDKDESKFNQICNLIDFDHIKQVPNISQF